MVKIGNAPVSYGPFEFTVGNHEGVPDADQVLDAVRAAGYAGIDIGPVGYLGPGRQAGGRARPAIVASRLERSAAMPMSAGVEDLLAEVTA